MQQNQWGQFPYGQQQPSFLNSQPTGFPGMGGLQPMQTGYNPQPQQQRSQATGIQGAQIGGNYAFLNQPPPNALGHNLTPQMTGFPGSGGGGLMPQQTGFNPAGGPARVMPQQTGYQGSIMSQSTGMGLTPQQTGWQGGLMSQPTGMGRLQPQQTGLPHDPRLQTMMQSFMPSNMSQPFAPSGAPQFAQAQQPLQQTFQSLLQNPSVDTPKIPWTLSRQEKKDYDQIFRAWDQKGEGFISGEMAREVFGQSGLSQDDLMKIWNLSDVDNRGKLNLPEFHVAMGLIYRALNGNRIPEKLPEELVPASMRDIDSTVNFMKDLLKHENTTRSSTSSPGSYTVPPTASKDALLYKHSDEIPSTYKPSSRHLDRKSVRYAGEDPDEGLKDIRRKLENTSSMLEKNAEKSAEDEELEEEIETLQYRVKRIQEDIEYTSKGRRTAEKDEERRKLERELLFLMHEKLPALERRQERRKDERSMEERAGVRRRDERNRIAGRYDDRDSRDEYDSYRGTFDRDRNRDRYDRDRYSYDRDHRDDLRDKDRLRDRYDRYNDREGRGDLSRYDSPLAVRSPPPAPPPQSSTSTATSAPPPPPPPASAAAVPSTKNMTPEERRAYIQEQAQKRINERLRALGVGSAPSEPEVDTSVQERLEKEKQEAEERSQRVEEEQIARGEARKKRLAEAGNQVEEPAKPVTLAASTPPLKSALKKQAPPPAPYSRAKQAPAPPPSRPHSVHPLPTAPIPVRVASRTPIVSNPEEDPEEAELRRNEEAVLKTREERRKRLEQLQKEEEEEKKKEEELLAARNNRNMGSNLVVTPSVEPVEPKPTSLPSVPPAAPAPVLEQKEQGSYNPFRKPGGTPAVTAGGGHNPFFKPPVAPASSAPLAVVDGSSETSTAANAPPPAPPAPPAPPPTTSQPRSTPTIRSPPSEPEWEDITEKYVNDSDSSDDEYTTSRAGRQGLAQALFGNIIGGGGSSADSRPGSVGPKVSPKALVNLGGGNPDQGRGALLSAIQGGARLKKTQTVDKSGPPGIGRVIGDTMPPSHNNNVPREHTSPSASVELSTEERGHSPVPPSEESYVGNPNRQSVDWYAGLAVDASHPTVGMSETSALEPTQEEQEPDEGDKGTGEYEKIDRVDSEADKEGELDDFDMDTVLRVRSLYQFDGTRNVDLSFKEDVVIEAHPAKDQNSPWWYGTVIKDGSKGWFPKNYVEEIKVTPAKALYEYAGGEADQLPFAEGDVLSVVDSSDHDWWKAERSGVIFLVPAAYLEIQAKFTIENSALEVKDSIEQLQDENLLPAGSITTKTLPVTDSSREFKSRLTSKLDEPQVSIGSVPTPLRNRPRAASTLSIASTTIPRSPSFITDVEEGESSSDDSVLSWWSNEESDSISESGSNDEGLSDQKEIQYEIQELSKPKKKRRAAPKPPKREEPGKEAERKRREAQRQSILAATGLRLKLEPPGVPERVGRTVSRRRPSPDVAKRKQRRHAPAIPEGKTRELPKTPNEGEQTEKLGIQDAYARYEAFLVQSTQQQAQSHPEFLCADSRPVSQVLTPQVTGPASVTALSPASTTASLHTPLPLNKETGGKISGFFKSMMTSHTSAESNRRSLISGATITRVDDTTSALSQSFTSLGPDGREPDIGNSDFGKTWSSLVESSVLETMDSHERKRQEAIFEFISTEIAYNRDLQLIVEVFYASLLSLLDEKALAVIFANIEDILLFNTGFLSALEDRQKASRLYIDKIGDVLQTLHEAGVYSTYCVNQHLAIKLLQNLREERLELETHLQNIRESNPSIRGLDLSHFLLIPMQRICRYPLLIKQIIHYTPSDSLDQSPLQDALRTVEVIVSQINEGIRTAEGAERLRILSENLWIGGEGRLDLTAPTTFLGPRKLVKEGLVSKTKSGRKLTMVLCNDIIVLMDGKDLYRMPLALHEIEVRQSRDSTGFAIKVDQKRGGDTIAVKATSAFDAKDWMIRINKVKREATVARKNEP
ncbi:uncharacterized protein L203_105207 [Cryptococcus depauperatus CBS 7841]|uniref:Actin cytoskeleton-regulatory complex protein PAN1 n=1 Tax=Cryptococcus depauperatus CBS 7841 TaxID=1295531 RepID=A0A1E3HYF2_9TREE|nr:multidomain RhoGEF [Cryptococcus depauperatus CBS 7841]